MAEIVNRTVYSRQVTDGYFTYGNDVELLSLETSFGAVQFEAETLASLLSDEETDSNLGAALSWSVDIPPPRARLIADVIDGFLHDRAAADSPDEIEEVAIEAAEHVNFEISPSLDDSALNNVAIRFYPKGGCDLYWFHYFKPEILLMFARDLRDLANRAKESD